MLLKFWMDKHIFFDYKLHSQKDQQNL